MQGGELLAEGEILKSEIGVGAEGRTQRVKEADEDGEHHVDHAGDGAWLNSLVLSAQFFPSTDENPAPRMSTWRPTGRLDHRNMADLLTGGTGCYGPDFGLVMSGGRP
jgi:hypothetical protein